MGVSAANLFENNVDPTGRDKARIIAHHTAAAPVVDVAISRTKKLKGAAVIENFANGDLEEGEFRPGNQHVSLQAGGETVFGPAKLRLKPFTGYLVYAVGGFDTDNFQFLVQPISGLK